MSRFLFLLFFPICSFGQNLEVIVKDIITQEPLPFANVIIEQSGLGASTNRMGVAMIPKSNLRNGDTLSVSYVGYTSLRKPCIPKVGTSTIEIELAPKVHELDGFEVEYTLPPPPKKMIKMALRKVKENYSQQDVIFHSLYRETIKENNVYIQLNEAVLKTYYTGYPKAKFERNIWYDWYHDESYAFDLEGNRLFLPLLHDFNTQQEKQVVVASRSSFNHSKYGMDPTLVSDPLLLFALDKIKYEYDFFNPSLLNKYEFKHLGLEEVEGELCYAISFIPKKGSGRFMIDMGRKNKSPIYIGRLYISKSSLGLVGFKYKLAVDRDFGFFAGRMPLDYEVEMKFKRKNGLYYINYIRGLEAKRVGRKTNGESIIHTAIKEIFVDSIQETNVQPFPDSCLFRSTRFSAIRYYYEKYNPSFWEAQMHTIGVPISSQVQKDLEKDEPLRDQFKSFHSLEKTILPAPIVAKRTFNHDYLDTTLIDNYHWMALPQHQEEFKEYLLDESTYFHNELKEAGKLQRKLFQEMNTFFPPADSGEVAITVGNYFFRDDSLSNEWLYYQSDSTSSLPVVNFTEFQEAWKNVHVERILPNDRKDLVAIEFKQLGDLGNTISILPFGASNQLDLIRGVYSWEWASDSTLLYTKVNEIGSARKLHFRNPKILSDTILYQEMDPEYDVEIRKSGWYLYCTIQSKTENEILWVDTGKSIPELTRIVDRTPGVEVKTSVANGVYYLINSEVEGSSVAYSKLPNSATKTLLARAEKKEFIIDILPVSGGVVGLILEQGSPKIKLLGKGKKKWAELVDLGVGSYKLLTADEKKSTFNFSFNSPAEPGVFYQYNLNTGDLVKLKTSRKIDPKYYVDNRIQQHWVKSHDGEKVPLTVVKKRSATKNQRGVILKTYGAYGAITLPFFDAREAILLANGYTIVYAHVRGEGMLGQKWYSSGRGLNKKNAILDYVACANYLIKEGLASPQLLIGYGNSAGGLVVAQAVNLNPSLFSGVILDHPFLDLINTMTNDTLPLTIDEYKEWGKPIEKDVFNYMLSYSPYQNISRQDYPPMLLIGSYFDFQTPPWQIAKYAAKLREYSSSKNGVYLLVDMQSGHIGNTTGKEWMKVFAKSFAFPGMKKD